MTAGRGSRARSARSGTVRPRSRRGTPPRNPGEGCAPGAPDAGSSRPRYLQDDLPLAARDLEPAAHETPEGRDRVVGHVGAEAVDVDDEGGARAASLVFDVASPDERDSDRPARPASLLALGGRHGAHSTDPALRGPGVGGVGLSEDHAIRSRAAGHTLAVEILQQRYHELAREPGQVLELGNLDPLPPGPAPPHLHLESVEVVVVNEQGLSDALERAL